jgi:PAS domain-containing protein
MARSTLNRSVRRTMRDQNKGKFDLVDDNTDLRKQVHDLKQSALERRRVEDGLRREVELLRTLVETAPVALCLFNTAGQPLLVNTAFARLLGYASTGELVRLATDLGLFIDPGDAAVSSALLTFRRKDNTHLTVSTIRSPISLSEPRALAIAYPAS